MRLVYIGVAFALVGCNATVPQQQYRPTGADDPSNACFTAISAKKDLAVIADKIPIGNARTVSIEMLSNQSRPTEEEKHALSAWAKYRNECAAIGRDFRSRYAPAGWALVYDEQQVAVLQAITGLYSGAKTFGQFNSERQTIGLQSDAKFEAAARNAQRAEAQDRRDYQEAARLQSIQRLQLLQAMQPPPLALPINPTVRCTSSRIGNMTNTTCN